MAERERDYAYEALAEVTSTDMNEGRGELNRALKSIKEQTPELAEENYLLSCEIHDRAALYRQVMGADILLTPSALAKHWVRVVEQAPKPAYPRQHVPADVPTRPGVCETCEGDKIVTVGTRPSKNPNSGYEETAPCPDCNREANGDFWRIDGTPARVIDPAEVRARMRG